MRGSIRTVMLAALAVCAFGALTVGTAFATRIAPANTAIKANIKEGLAAFLPSNAFATTSIQCVSSETTGTTPTQIAPPGGTENNTNRTGTGTFSTGPGDVIMDITKPSFTECGVYVRSGGAWVKVEGAEVKTNETNGKWTFSGDFISTAIPVAIAVPSNGAKIFVPTEAAPTCTITVSNERASAVTGRWTNGTNSTTAPSSIRIDSQVSFNAPGVGTECPVSTSPAQEEAIYSVKTNPEGATPVKFEA